MASKRSNQEPISLEFPYLPARGPASESCIDLLQRGNTSTQLRSMRAEDTQTRPQGQQGTKARRPLSSIRHVRALPPPPASQDPLSKQRLRRKAAAPHLQLGKHLPTQLLPTVHGHPESTIHPFSLVNAGGSERPVDIGGGIRAHLARRLLPKPSLRSALPPLTSGP